MIPTHRGIRVRLLVGIGLGACMFAGCGPQVEAEYPVKGSVTLDGSPLASGEVYFRDESTATGSSFTVNNGQFEGQSEAGTFKVEIHSFREEAPKADATGYMPEGPIKTNIIPPEYNANSKLTADVKAEGANEFKFEAKSK